MGPRTVSWYDSPLYDRHDNGPMHPERPPRLDAVRESLARPDLESRLVRMSPPDVSHELLSKVHRPDYIETIRRAAESGGGWLDADTSLVPASWPAARAAAGAVADAVRGVMEGTFHRSFCSVRPPGHHAMPARAMGFCLFGNAAVGAQAAIDAGCRRVAIIDWDVHHGNGTQAIFWQRSDVFYASWHQYPFYPGTGAESEVGVDEGYGRTLNCPLPAGAGDTDYLRCWTDRIGPALEEFEPEFLIISAGFDADGRDPLGGHRVTAAGFESLSRSVVEWADARCHGRIVSVLEGGYSLEALTEDVGLHVGTLL